MELAGDANRIALFCSVTAASSLTLAFAAFASFPSSQANTDFWSVVTCHPSGEGVLALHAGLNELRGNDTAKVNGSNYWKESFVVGWDPSDSNYTAAVLFHGVHFDAFVDFSYQFSHTLPRASFTLENATLLLSRGANGSRCYYLLPSFVVHFTGDCTSECFRYNDDVTATATLLEGSVPGVNVTIAYPSIPQNPWFIASAGNGAGITYDRESGLVTLYALAK